MKPEKPKPKIFIETLKNGHFVKTPVGNIFLSFCMNENDCFNIYCENDKIIICGAGNGPRKLIVEPLDMDRIAIRIINVKPIRNPMEDLIKPVNEEIK